MHLELPYEGIADVWCCDRGREVRATAPYGSTEGFIEEILGRYLGSDAKTVSVVRDPLGKPAIASPPSTRLGFSVAYSKNVSAHPGTGLWHPHSVLKIAA